MVAIVAVVVSEFGRSLARVVSLPARKYTRFECVAEIIGRTKIERGIFEFFV